MLDIEELCAYCGSYDIQYDEDDDLLFCVDCQSTDIIWNVDHD